MKKASKKGHFAHISNEIKICSQNKCHHHLSNVCENSFRMFHSSWVIQTAKQMNGNQNWPSYCETYEMNFHRRWKGDDGIYFGYRFWFHCLYEQNGLFSFSFFFFFFGSVFHANGVFGIWFQWFLLFCMIYCITVKKPIDTSKKKKVEHSSIQCYLGTGVSWLDPEKTPHRKRDSNPGSSALEADALPLGQRGGRKAWIY